MTNSSHQNGSSTFPQQHVRRVLSGLLLTIAILSSAHSAELAHIALEERLGLEFAAQPLNYTVTIRQGAAKDTTRLALRDTNGAPRLVQFKVLDSWADGSIRRLRVSFVAELEAQGRQRFVVDDSGARATDDGQMKIERSGQSLVLRSALVAVEIPARSWRHTEGRKAPGTIPPPVSRLRGAARRWYGSGQMNMDSYLWLRERRVDIADDGPIYKTVNVSYAFTNGVPSSTGAGNESLYNVQIRLNRSEELIRIKESYSLPFTDLSHFEFAFNFAPGLNPDRTVCRPLTSAKGPAMGLESFWDFDRYHDEMFPISYGRDDGLGFLTPWAVAASSWFHFACYNDRLGEQAEMVGIINTAPEKWDHLAYLVPQETWKLVQNPHAFFSLKPIKDVRVTVGKDQSLTAHFRLNRGSREWAFFVGGPFPRTEEAEVGRAPNKKTIISKAAPRRHFKRKARHYYWRSLDTMKDYVLTWKRDPAITYPRLYADGAQYEARRQAYNAWYGAERLPPLSDPTLRETMKKKLLAGSGAIIPTLVTNPGPAYHDPGNAAFQAAHLSDLLFGTGVLSPAEEDLIRTRMAAMAYILERRAYWDPGIGYAANPNMSTLHYAALGILGLALPDHPRASVWVDAYLRQADAEMKHWMSDDGAWIESLHYVRASWNSHAMLFAALKSLGIRDYYRNPRVRKFIEWYFMVQTPPDPERKNFRRLECLDNSLPHESIDDFAYWAYGIRDVDPDFAEQLMWMWFEQGFGNRKQEAHNSLKWYAAHCPTWWGKVCDYYLLALQEPQSIKPTSPGPLRGGKFEGFGAILQSHFPSAKETKVFFRMSKTYSHMDMSTGHFVFWGKGAPLVMDHGNYVYHPWLHNRISVNHMWDDDLGEVTSFFAGAGASFVEGHSTISHLSLREHRLVKEWPMKPEPINGRSLVTDWTRRLVMMKDEKPEGLNYLVIRDIVTGELPTEWVLWAYGEVQDFQATPVVAKGKFGVDLLLYLLDRDKGKVNTGVVDLSSLHPKRRKQTLIHLRRPAGRGVLAVLYPASAQEAAPTVEKFAGNTGVKVKAGERTDWVFLPEGSGSAEIDGLSFRGTMASVSRRPDVDHYMVDSRTRLTAAGSTLTCNVPVEFFVYKDRIEGLVTGKHVQPVVRLSGKLAERATQLSFGGAVTELAAEDGDRKLTLPAEETRFTIQLK